MYSMLGTTALVMEIGRDYMITMDDLYLLIGKSTQLQREDVVLARSIATRNKYGGILIGDYAIYPGYVKEIDGNIVIFHDWVANVNYNG